MKPRYKIGLMVGAVGLVLNVCVSTAMGVCGPLMALLAGAVSGFLTARQERPPSKGEGAKAGAISGALAGALVLVGQVIGGVAALVLIQNSGMQLPFGQIPTPGADPAQQAVYYVTGFGTGVCFGVVGAVLSALAAAGTAYLATPESQLPAQPLNY